MDKKRVYKTKQKELVFNALGLIGGGHATVENIAACLKEKGDDVGIATVYRNLDKLVNEGEVLRYTLPGSASACYQILEHGEEHKPHCHAICTSCGNIEHLECSELEDFGEHLYKHHNFRLDNLNTVFYGLCGLCLEKG